MRRLALEFLGFVLTVAVLELWFARRWFGRKPLGYSVAAAAGATGVLWMAFVVGLAHVEWGWKTVAEPQLTSSEWMVNGVLIFVDTVIFTGVALIPAAVVGIVYRNRRAAQNEKQV